METETSISTLGDKQYANSELFLLPHFFSSKNDPSFPFSQLLDSDSVLKHLMDDWKEESIEENYASRKYFAKAIRNSGDITLNTDYM